MEEAKKGQEFKGRREKSTEQQRDAQKTVNPKNVEEWQKGLEKKYSQKCWHKLDEKCLQRKGLKRYTYRNPTSKYIQLY